MGSCCSPDRGPSISVSGAGTPARPVPPAVQAVAIPGGRFTMGSEDELAYPTDLEGPVREVDVASFSIGATAVTNAEFARFVEATDHVSTAEQFGDSFVFAGLLPALERDQHPASNPRWWRIVPGASWRHPEGPDSSIAERQDHPVVHVSHTDALAYARWAGGRLPIETEWEYASRGGLHQQPYPWGAQFEPAGVAAMNTWQGTFPDGPLGHVGTVPADAFAPNGYGLHNTTGNVWEWTASRFAPWDERPVLRGGSYLCHESYCRRYRTSARMANSPDSTTGHTGFRVAFDPAVTATT